MKITIVALLLSTCCLSTAAYGNPKAGFMTSEMTNFAGPMTITVWYPTSSKAKGPSNYVFFGGLDVPAGATRDAPIKGGTFPLIVLYPGGGGPDTRASYFPNAELLAADGYIVVNPGRNTQLQEEQGPLLSALIDHMLYQHPLRDSVDASKIGAKGLSFGGIGVASLAGGDFFGNPPDARVRGVIIDEGIVQCGVIHNCTAATIPILLRDGSPLGGIGGLGDMAPQFAAFDNAFPRFLATLYPVSHFGFVTDACLSAEAGRVASLDYQENVLGGIVEPEPRNFAYLFVAIGNGDLGGIIASLLWHFDALGVGDGTFGSAGDSCQFEFGGPDPVSPAVNSPLVDQRTMIETLYATDLAFWQDTFSNGSSKKLEKAVKNLHLVASFSKVTE